MSFKKGNLFSTPIQFDISKISTISKDESILKGFESIGGVISTELKYVQLRCKNVYHN